MGGALHLASKPPAPFHFAGLGLHANAQIVRAALVAREVLAHVRVVADLDLDRELLVARDLDGEARALGVSEAVVAVVLALDVDGDRVAAGRERVRVHVLPVVGLEALRRGVDGAVVERDHEAPDLAVVAVGLDLDRDARVKEVVAHRGDARAERGDVADELVVVDRRRARVAYARQALGELVRRGVERRRAHAAVAHLGVHHLGRRNGARVRGGRPGRAGVDGREARVARRAFVRTCVGRGRPRPRRLADRDGGDRGHGHENERRDASRRAHGRIVPANAGDEQARISCRTE